AMVIATTHHSALKSFAYNNDKMMNASMSFNDKDLAPTYEFKAGIPGSSYAIEIARRYHMPENILEFARKRIGKGREKLEKLITDLQRKIHRYDSNLKGLKNREADLKEKSQSIDKMKKEISVKYKKADKEALKKSQVFVQNMYSEFERTIQELKESQASPAAIKKARTELAGLQSEVSEKLDKVEESKEQQLSIQKLKAGDKVWVKSMEQNGIIREINQKNNKIWVDISGTRMRLDIGWLAPHRKRKQKIQTTVTSDNSFVKYRLDLRGKRMDTAISELEKFLDSAILSGLNSVEILHGKGDGILKRAVEDMLPSDPRVKKFQMAPVEQGGAGITLVDLNK
ncbi:MAG: Smr/MutS family protein, partial [Candidatus Marinimicrobia bacterium]|nr:Smr/MutS family protein [Candidatus Neomarinimicrobiota bacterium]